MWRVDDLNGGSVAELNRSERRAMNLTVELANTLRDVVLLGPTRDEDLRELVYHIHGIQHALMANAFAREHLSEYRVMGGEVL